MILGTAPLGTAPLGAAPLDAAPPVVVSHAWLRLPGVLGDPRATARTGALAWTALGTPLGAVQARAMPAAEAATSFAEGAKNPLMSCPSASPGRSSRPAGAPEATCPLLPPLASGPPLPLPSSAWLPRNTAFGFPEATWARWIAADPSFSRL